MLTPYGHIWYLGASAGYGCFLNGEPVSEVSISGNIYGYTCSVQHNFSDDTTIIILSNNDNTPIGRILKGIKEIIQNGESKVEIKPQVMGTYDLNKYKELSGKYHFPHLGWQFEVKEEAGKLTVDRLFIQQAKRKNFKLELVDSNAEQTIFACDNCDSKYTFTKDEKGNVSVLYTWDTLNLPCVKMREV